MKNNMKSFVETKIISKDLDESDTKNQGKIEATITTWGPREGVDGRKFNYKPEPFKAWADEMHAQKKTIPMFIQHNESNIPIGEWSEFLFDENGMSGVGRIFVNTTSGRDIYTILKESPNLFQGVSMGPFAEEYAFVDENGELTEDAPYFQITKGGVNEASLVISPNNLEAKIRTLESIIDNKSNKQYNDKYKNELKELEQILDERSILKILEKRKTK